MSLVFITHHNENIYDHALRKIVDGDQKRPSLVLKSNTIASSKPKPNEDAKTKQRCTLLVNIGGCTDVFAGGKYQWRTMGPPEVPLNIPSNFLKKHSGVKWTKRADHKCIKRNISPVPRHDELIPLPEHFQKNFVDHNKTEISSLIPKRPLPKYAYTVYGDVKLLCNSGIMPAYIFSPNFGKVPNYLRSVSKITAIDENTHKSKSISDYEKLIGKRKMVRKADDGPRKCNIRQISNEERMQIKSGLKEQWRIHTNSFQRLSVLSDTLPNIRRENNLRSLLNQIEKDILFLESNPALYVETDQK